MVQKVDVVLTCDRQHNGETEGVRTISWTGPDGAAHEIDECAKHAEQTDKAFAKLAEGARRAAAQNGHRRRGASGPAPRTPAKRQEDAEVRAWAQAMGFKVSDRGRIAARIRDDYDAAGGKLPGEPVPAPAADAGNGAKTAGRKTRAKAGTKA